jgi:hypothetical protein
MHNFKIKLEEKSTNKKFILLAIHYTESVADIPFTFRNSTKDFEMGRIIIEDKKNMILKNIGSVQINPIERTAIETTINKTKPFIYEVNGNIEDNRDSIILDLIYVQYLLKKGEPYYLYVKYNGEITNKIKLLF